MSPEEILKKEYGDSKNFLTPWVLGRGALGDYAAYELSRTIGNGMDGKHPFYGVSVVAYLPEFSITRRMTDLSKSSYDIQYIKNYVKRLKRNPGIIQAELDKLDFFLCAHGVNRWHHPECWLYHMTGDEKYKKLIEGRVEK